MALVLGACDRTPASPTTTTVVPTLPPRTTLVVTGIVFGDGQPVENAGLEVGGTRVFVKTDATGRYTAELENFGPTIVWVTAYDDGFRFQPCAVWFEHTEPGNSVRNIDVALTSAKGPSSAPSAPVAGRRIVSGTVYTETSSGKRPAPNAVVGWDLGNDDLKAWTETDSAGRFRLCGVWVSTRVGIVAYQGTLQGFASLEPGGNADIEVILK